MHLADAFIQRDLQYILAIHFILLYSLLLNIQMYIAYIIFYLHLFPSLCPHTVLFFDAAKFSIKLFTFIYCTVSVVRQLNKYEKVTETRPIKITQPALPSKICKNILIIEP